MNSIRSVRGVSACGRRACSGQDTYVEWRERRKVVGEAVEAFKGKDKRSVENSVMSLQRMRVQMRYGMVFPAVWILALGDGAPPGVDAVAYLGEQMARDKVLCRSNAAPVTAFLKLVHKVAKTRSTKQIINAFTSARVDFTALFHKLANHLLTKPVLPTFNHELATVALSSFAHFSIHNIPLTTSVLSRIKHEPLPLSRLSVIGYSLYKLRYAHPPFLMRIVDMISNREGTGGCTVQHINNLIHILVWLVEDPDNENSVRSAFRVLLEQFEDGMLVDYDILMGARLLRGLRGVGMVDEGLLKMVSEAVSALSGPMGAEVQQDVVRQLLEEMVCGCKLTKGGKNELSCLSAVGALSLRMMEHVMQKNMSLRSGRAVWRAFLELKEIGSSVKTLVSLAKNCMSLLKDDSQLLPLTTPMDLRLILCTYAALNESNPSLHTVLCDMVIYKHAASPAPLTDSETASDILIAMNELSFSHPITDALRACLDPMSVDTATDIPEHRLDLDAFDRYSVTPHDPLL